MVQLKLSEKKAITGLLFLVALVISGALVQVFDTGEEATCRTNKPIGWEIIEDYGEFVLAECQYVTKDYVQKYCKPEFRSTASYARYGCAVVEIYIPPEDDKVIVPSGSAPGAKVYTCVFEDYGGCTEA